MSATAVVAIVAGVVFVVSALGSIGYDHYTGAQEKKELRKMEIDNDIAAYRALISMFENIKSDLNDSKGLFNDAKQIFKSGGHVMDDVPLANNEFETINGNISSAVSTIDSLIAEYNNEIQKLTDEKASL